jgi:site-specific recombinase XerD
MRTTIDIICQKQRTLKNGETPLLIRLTRNRNRKYLSIGISINPVYWDFEKNKPKRNCPNGEYIETIMQEKIAMYRKQILDFQVEDKDYSLDKLNSSVRKPVKNLTVEDYLNEIISSLEKENRIGNSKHYIAILHSLKQFNKTIQIPFSEIDISFLNRYESYLRQQKNKENTIGVKFRTLRAAYNKAIKDNVVKKDYYPFDDFNVSRLKEVTPKRAISKEDIQKIIDFDVSTITKHHSSLLQLSKDWFLFSYFGCGINLIDMAYLTKQNRVNDRIIYDRHKTGKYINFKLQPIGADILDRYENPQSDYLFPIFKNNIHVTAKKQHQRIKKMTYLINKNLRKIGESLEINTNITTYVARHSFATVLKRSGVNIALISEALGHSDLATTQIYLDSFENSQIDEAMSNLL